MTRDWDNPRPNTTPPNLANLALLVPVDHATLGVQMVGAKDGTAEGFVAAADALLYEAFKTLPMGRFAPDGTPFHELHDRARNALRGLLAGLCA